ncbi:MULTISPECIES: hypothetical protein [unclassified Variovorax]|uniref:hypothetical protein n=1 Tax=unclassified Variovorax TaxID=663243 RepID=UPI00076D0A64|nr:MULTISPECIES: hypothetical protein [unclassified Variovorax]KWT94111.1 hypothetical protein APY03_2707 [Variovorax sp. WDL1]PNG59929.1 hypothetical protein CHC07_01658 [Variovorax sp. B4]PNG60279.1 hypothetical protein CHC06_00176 [Variovorax sp. B2]VTV13880.1 hypothetical protein WDL1CHR_04495 [Variovorax sp. WDL1]
MKSRDWMSILWPAFLLASAAELLVFALVDPSDLHWRGEAIGLSRQAVYAAGFFIFWVLATGSSALTLLLTKRADELNRQAG